MTTNNKYPVRSVLGLIKTSIKDKVFTLPDGKQARMTDTLKTLTVRGTHCSRCGSKGCQFESYNDRDEYIHIRLVTKDGTALTKDHVIPASKNGGNSIHNYQIFCEKCNSHKQDEMPNLTPIYKYRSVKEQLCGLDRTEKVKRALDYHNYFVSSKVDSKIPGPHTQVFCALEKDMKEYLDFIRKTFGITIPIEKITTIPPEEYFNDSRGK